MGSRLPPHKKENSNFSIFFNSDWGGFRRAVNRWTNFEINSDFITVILPMVVRFLLRQSMISFSICKSFCSRFACVMLLELFVKCIPNIFLYV